ncbi:MAG: phosphoribosylformylglycinamidine synthase [Cyclobacteriaceae bacterium]|nr:phosphoribosylformylglycinamidine synthase [Cyclobacteriaceae bacterium]
MVLFFKSDASLIALKIHSIPASEIIARLKWLFGNAEYIQSERIEGTFIGPRKEMITPWSTNAVEITQNMGISGIERIEEFTASSDNKLIYDPMLQRVYHDLDQSIFTIDKKPEPVLFIEDIAAYNKKEGLALSGDEIEYLVALSKKLNRKLTDSEIFGFSQVNSEHCRHKIFNGTFVIDGKEMPDSLFQLIKLTTKKNPNRVVSAYKDNCAFIQGPVIEQFAPERQDVPAYFKTEQFESVISIKAETHNFPTTVEPFNGAATGSGGEIRDRIGGGKAAMPLAGTAVYMTSYPRLGGERPWEKSIKARKWLYHDPAEILIKASNGASDFGNKFGQPLICGSLMTFEHFEEGKEYGFDKVIMLAGGIGYGKKKDSLKGIPEKGDQIVLLGGDNYRIGMGGGAVSSVATGEYNNAIELNAVQRSNPEMQKRVSNAIRALAEMDENPVVSIHDHGAGGHLNCLSELVESTGGKIILEKLPIGDPTLSDKEIVGNESQERMGLLLKKEHIPLLRAIAERERAPIYVVGEATGDHQFTFEHAHGGTSPIDLKLEDMFGNPPKTIMKDSSLSRHFEELTYDTNNITQYIADVLQLEEVACKDWLTNKVDRSVTGKVAKQQCAGPLQLPLNNLGVSALDYHGIKGIATAIGHAPAVAIVDPGHGSVLSIAESLTNIIWAPIEGGLKGVSLSANWMWPCKNPGEDARLYNAVRAASDFALALGINIPTGKDSLSMTQKYGNGEVVYAPGTVIISAAGEVSDIRKVVEPVLKNYPKSILLYIDFSGDRFKLGGSSFAQTLNRLGNDVPTVADPAYFSKAFNIIQALISEGLVLAGHDISAGGMITTLLEMVFSQNETGITINLASIPEQDLVKVLFSQNPGIIIQVDEQSDALDKLKENGISFHIIGRPVAGNKLILQHAKTNITLDIADVRDAWFRTSYLLDVKQSGATLAKQRFDNYKHHTLHYKFPEHFSGRFSQYGIDPKRKGRSGIKAAIIREKGVNGDREMAWMMHLAGFDVKDVHMTDLISGRETLGDISFIVFVGGFSNSDVLGSAKGWAGAFIYNPLAKEALDRFYAREDTLSLGVCNGCQVMVALGVVTPGHDEKPVMLHNESGKFESIFLNVDIQQNHSVMLQSLAGSRLGIWVAHGEGKFSLPKKESEYHIPMKFSGSQYPANPNGSDFNTASLCSDDGRHLVMMPHLERSTYPWNWGHYPEERKADEITPWVEAFVNAREWIKKTMK